MVMELPINIVVIAGNFNKNYSLEPSSFKGYSHLNLLNIIADIIVYPCNRKRTVSLRISRFDTVF